MPIYVELYPYFNSTKIGNKDKQNMRQCSWCGWVCWKKHWAEHRNYCGKVRPVDLDTWPEQGYYWFQLHPNKERLKWEPDMIRDFWRVEYDLIIEAVAHQLKMGQYIPWEYARYAHEIIKAGLMSGRTMFKRQGAWKVPLEC